MFREYALEPAVLSTWERVRFFLDAMDPSKGRFLSRFPRAWKKLVYDNLNCRDVEKKRVEQRLATLEQRVFLSRPGAYYDGNSSWLQNARIEHARFPFHAIVADCSAEEGVLSAESVDEQCEPWRTTCGCMVPRDPACVVKLLDVLFRASSKVVIIDPYFRADQPEKLDALIRICSAIDVSRTSIEVHFADEPRGYNACMRDAERVLPARLPPRLEVKLRCWIERTGGPRLHNRYILTDVSGVKFGDGIERGACGQEDHISIVDESSRAQLWEQYTGMSPSFDEAGQARTFVGITQHCRL